MSIWHKKRFLISLSWILVVTCGGCIGVSKASTTAGAMLEMGNIQTDLFQEFQERMITIEKGMQTMKIKNKLQADEIRSLQQEIREQNTRIKYLEKKLEPLTGQKEDLQSSNAYENVKDLKLKTSHQDVYSSTERTVNYLRTIAETNSKSETPKFVRTVDAIYKQEVIHRGPVQDGVSAVGVQIHANEDNKHRKRTPPLSMMEVAFFAVLNKAIINPVVGQTIAFDDVKTNLGNAYSKSRGIFTAPTAGVYMFTVTLMSSNRSRREGEVQARLKHNGDTAANILAHGWGDRHAQGFNVAILSLLPGDSVYVEDRDNVSHADDSVYGQYYSSFSGFRIY